MGIVQTKSATITNRDASPPVINDGRLERGTLKSAVGSVAVGAADSATSYYPLVALPSTAMVRAIYLTCPAGMTALVGHHGVFKNTKASGGSTTGVPAFGSVGSGSDILFAAASALVMSAVKARVDVTDVSGTYPTNLREQPLWQAAGLAADPGGTFDIGIVVDVANSGAAGRVGFEVQYVDNGS